MDLNEQVDAELKQIIRDKITDKKINRMKRKFLVDKIRSNIELQREIDIAR